MINLSKITLGQYASRDSFIHQLDPRTKLFVCMLFMTLILTWTNIWILIGGLFVLIFIFMMANLSPLLAWRNVVSFLWLLLFTFIIHSFFTDGKIIVKLPILKWSITKEGVFAGFFYSFRIILLILIANVLTLTTSPIEFTDGLERILKPLRRIKIPVHEIAMMISIALRFIPILLEEIERIQKAQLSRGARFTGNILQRIRGIIPIVIPLFISTFRRANDLALAMDARCYRGGNYRTSYQVLKLRFRDWLIISSSCFILILFIAV